MACGAGSNGPTAAKRGDFHPHAAGVSENCRQAKSYLGGSSQSHGESKLSNWPVRLWRISSRRKKAFYGHDRRDREGDQIGSRKLRRPSCPNWRAKLQSRSSMRKEASRCRRATDRNASVKTAGKTLDLLRPLSISAIGRVNTGRREKLRRRPKRVDGRHGKAE